MTDPSAICAISQAITSALLGRARNACVTVRRDGDALWVAVQHTILEGGGAYVLTPEERFDGDGDLDSAMPAILDCAVAWATAAVEQRIGPRTEVTAPEPGRQWNTGSALTPARALVQWLDGRSGGARDGD